MKIAVVGPGRLGKSLAVLWTDAGHTVTLVGRGASLPVADVVVLTVPDSHIQEVASTIYDEARILLHTSGACGVEVLAPHPCAGSWHPMMTFPGPEVNIPALKGIVAALAGHPDAISVGRQLATDLGMRPLEVPGDRRLYHAAAVIAGNFSAALLLEASRVLEMTGVPEELAKSVLAPLAIASIRNAATSGAQALTGPAIRGDDRVLDGHRTALIENDLQDLVTVYDELSRRSRLLRTSNPALPAGEEDDPK